MKATKTAPNSPFLQAAIELDMSFNELVSMGQALDELDLQSDYGMAQARKILVRFSEAGQRVGVEIETLARTLTEAKDAAEAATEKVASRSLLVQERHNKNEELLGRFQHLGEVVKKIAMGVTEVVTLKHEMTEKDRELIHGQIPQIISQLGVLLDESNRIKEDAQSAQMKSLEKDAVALGQSIHSIRSKLSNYVLTQSG